MATPNSRVVVISKMTYGDFVLILPFLSELRKRHPAARITVLCGRRGSSLCRLYPMVDEIVNLGDICSWPGLRRELYKMCALFRSDFIYALHPLFESGLLSFLLGGRRRIGFHQAEIPLFDGKAITPRRTVNSLKAWLLRRFLLNESVQMRICDAHSAARFLQLIPEHGKPGPSLCGQLSQLYPRSATERRRFILAPFSGWTPRNWPLERWVDLARLLLAAEPDAEVLISVDPPSAALALNAFAAVPGVEIFEPGEDFHRLFQTFATASLVVSSDSFPLHAASALNVPSVGLFGPNLPKWFGGLAEIHADLFQPIECSPCVQGLGHEPCLRGFATCAALAAWSAQSVSEHCLAVLRQQAASPA